MGERLQFFRHFLRHPLTTGAIVPSGPALCRFMVSDLALTRAHAVTELGTGTGVITRAILAELGPQTVFFSVEIDAELCDKARAAMPGVTIFHADAGRLPELAAQVGTPELDAVISGLPWALFPEPMQQRILNAVVQTLAPGGVFTTYAYLQGILLPAGRRFRRLLGRTFGEVEVSKAVWKNLPPAVIYRCRVQPDSRSNR